MGKKDQVLLRRYSLPKISKKPLQGKIYHF